MNRYSRQISMAEIGEAGQEKLNKTSVLLVGLGGLGSPAALYLAAAGVGRLGLMDFDHVDTSNLQRQILYSSEETGQTKVKAASRRLLAFNPEIQIMGHDEKLTVSNAMRIFRDYDFILDGADNFATRFLANDAAYFSRKTLVSASVLGFEGQLSVFSNEGPCYRCLYPEPPPAGSVPSCAEAGVLGTMPGILGTLQAQEVLKQVLGLGESMKGKLILFNGLNLSLTTLEISKNPDCPLCGPGASIKELREEHFICSTDAVIKSISKTDLQELLRTKRGSYQILDVREASELQEEALPYTHHIPLNRLPEDFVQLSQETPVVVYCRSGNRSLKACELLKQKGYQVINLKDGIKG